MDRKTTIFNDEKTGVKIAYQEYCFFAGRIQYQETILLARFISD